MVYPFMGLSNKKRKNVFLLMLISTLSIMAILYMVGKPLENRQAPYGIISFELAGTVSQVSEILSSWDANARIQAGFSLGFDYLYMVFYSITIALACVWAGKDLGKRGPILFVIGILLAWGQFLAAGIDAVENLALTKMLFGVVQVPWPEVARVCALVKFSLILLGIVYAFFGLTLHFFHPAKS